MKVRRYPLSYPAENIYMRLWEADARAFVWLRRLLIALICAVGLLQLRFFVLSLFPPYLYMKDFIQEYLLARAVMSEVNPYLPLPILVEKFIGPVTVPLMPHATPHPPPAIFLGLPFAVFPYSWAAAIWGVLTLVCAGITVQLILKDLTGKCPSVFSIIVVTLIWLGWRPFLYELIYGQLMIVLSFLLVVAWRCIRDERNLLGGVFLGLVFAFKLMAWPILLFFALRKDWKLVSAALVTIVLLNLGAMLLITPEVVKNYYIEAPAITSLYRNFAYNFSVWTVGWRLLEGTFSPVLVGIEAPPLIHAPLLAPFVTYVVLFAFVVGGLVLARRAETFDVSFGILLGLSTLVNPVAWVHYFTWLVFPLTLLVQRLVVLKFPYKESWASMIGVLVLTIPPLVISQLSCMLSGINCAMGQSLSVPFWAALVSYIQPVCVILLIFLLWRVDKLTNLECVCKCHSGGNVA